MVHVNGRRKQRENVGIFGGQRKSSTVVPRKSTGEWTCRRLRTWLREIGLEIVDTVVKSDSEPALTSLIESTQFHLFLKENEKNTHEKKYVCTNS